MYEKDATMVSKFALSKKQWRKIWQAGKVKAGVEDTGGVEE